jgi:hypothetical protein
MEKRAMVTRCDSNAVDLAAETHPFLKNYADQWGCDFLILDKKEDWMTDYELAHYRIFNVKKLLEFYDRVLVIDTDILIMPGTPNPFDIVPEDRIGTIFEDVGSRAEHRTNVIQQIQNKFGDVHWNNGYINTGFFIVSKQHANIFERIAGEVWDGFGYDDAHIGWNIHKHNHRFCELPFQWNHMSMFSEPWNNSASRFDSYIIHYAGNAQFPDDKSGRGVISNNALDKRLELIKNDIERIAEGLMTFKDVEVNPYQGEGSKMLTGKMGVNEKPIMLKIPVDGIDITAATRLYRELHTFALNIPNTVHFLGMGEDPDHGKFMMLERLMQIPYPISKDQLVKIAIQSLIAMRQLYKAGIPWICRLDHIMIDERGETKLVDFNDDPFDRDIPFFHHDGGEAIIMDGLNCDEDGNVKERYIKPWSGWKACMAHLAMSNDLSVNEIWATAIEAMWSHEYQALKNVHQPIHIGEYAHIYRTETEKNDKDYGNLVPANRECTDREKIILDNLPSCIEDSDTWLDIGSNVGWFCHAFDDYFTMIGLEADTDMCVFAEMQGEYLGSRARFINKTLDIHVAQDLPMYDNISALSVIHWSLVKPPAGSSQTSIGEGREYFLDLLKAICSKVRKMFILEFPTHCFSALGVVGIDEFITVVRKTGDFKEVGQIGVSDAGRPILRCLK